MRTTVSQSVPLLDLSPEIESLWDELQHAIQSVLRSGQFILGPQLRAFEQEASRYLGVKHAVGVNSGTDALVIGLRALGVGVGDEVITTPFTFFATAEAISQVGAIPVFVDIDPITFNLDAALVEARITERTTAILPVHLFGHAADLGPILTLARRYGLRVLEDVAQGFGGEYEGRKLGSIGDAGAFSFFPSKNLAGCGDGGLITTNNDSVAEAARMLRAHGAKRKYFNETIGYNSRLDELQAAILRVKLPHVDTANAGRRRVATRYSELLAGLPYLLAPAEAGSVRHVYNQYTVRIREGLRDLVRERLAAAEIQTMIFYPVPLHRLPVYAHLGDSLPVSEAAAEDVLSLPIWPGLPEEVQERVVDELRRALE